MGLMLLTKVINTETIMTGMDIQKSPWKYLVNPTVHPLFKKIKDPDSMPPPKKID